MNPLKERLRRGDLVTMVDPTFTSPALCEELGHLGFDAIFIDCEHHGASPGQAEEMARAAHAAGIAAVLRPELTVPHLLVRYLDRGIDGLMLSEIEDAATARSVVEVIRSARAEAGDFADKLIVIEITSLRAMANIEEIAAIDEIDVLFIGSGGLARALGHPGERYHPDVVALCVQGMEAVRRAGKASGSLARYEDVEYVLRAGVQFLYVFMRPLLARAVGQYQELVAQNRQPT